MIIDKNKLEKISKPHFTRYVYDLDSAETPNQAAVILIAKNADGKSVMEVYLSNKVDTSTPIGEKFTTDEIALAWKKFEDLFEQNKQQQEKQDQQQKKENPPSLYMTVEKDGAAIVYLLYKDGKQEKLIDIVVSDPEVSRSALDYAKLDFTDDMNMPEEFRTKWYLANMFGDGRFESSSPDSTVYSVALESVTPPNEEKANNGGDDSEEGQEGDGEGQEGDGQKSDKQGQKSDKQGDGSGGEKSDDKAGGEPQDGEGQSGDGSGEGQKADKQDSQPDKQGSGESDGEKSDEPADGEPKEGKPTEDEGDVSDSGEKSVSSQSDSEEIDYNEVIKEISEKTNKSVLEIAQALRTESTFSSFLNIEKINYKELLKSMGYDDSITKSKFTKEIFNAIKKK